MTIGEVQTAHTLIGSEADVERQKHTFEVVAQPPNTRIEAARENASGDPPRFAHQIQRVCEERYVEHLWKELTG